jgi:hypothetical protein
MAERAHQHGVGIARVHEDRADVAGRVQPRILPAFAAVGGPVDAIAGADVVTRRDLAGAGVDHVRVGRGYCQRADRRRRQPVAQGAPGLAGIAGFPHPAAGGAEIKCVGLVSDALGHGCPTGAHGSQQAPLHGGGNVGVIGAGKDAGHSRKKYEACRAQGTDNGSCRHGYCSLLTSNESGE